MNGRDKNEHGNKIIRWAKLRINEERFALSKFGIFFICLNRLSLFVSYEMTAVFFDIVMQVEMEYQSCHFLCTFMELRHLHELASLKYIVTIFLDCHHIFGLVFLAFNQYLLFCNTTVLYWARSLLQILVHHF